MKYPGYSEASSCNIINLIKREEKVFVFLRKKDMLNRKRPILAFAICLIFGLMGTLKAEAPAAAAPAPAAPATATAKANAQKQPGK